MSKKKTTQDEDVVDESVDELNDQQADEADTELAEVVEPDVQAGKFAAEPSTSAAGPTQKRGSGAVAWLALLVSAIAIAAIAFDFLRDLGAAGDALENNAEIRTLASSLGNTQEALNSLEQNITALQELDAERATRIDAIGELLNDRLRQLESLPGRLSSVEATMASIQGISTGARDAWLLAEAEYYMQIANAQLQLAGNPALASLALTHADDRIVQLGDPRLTNVRQALSDELRALETVAKPDTAGITFTLASLADSVDLLPLRQDVVVREDLATEIDPELSGMDRAIESLKSAVGGVVSVRRADEAMQPLIAPEAQYFLRANLALQLQAARLALLRGEESIFRQSLDDADSWLVEYYDPGSIGVQNARKTIAEIRDSIFSVAMPDISQSLRLLRQSNVLAEATQSVDPGQNR
jgi:uroporphyrin-3 C-methyltransferase